MFQIFTKYFNEIVAGEFYYILSVNGLVVLESIILLYRFHLLTLNLYKLRTET